MRYFTSDLHLGSNVINRVAHRPYWDSVEAVDKLTDNINHTCSKTDALIHVGDFMLSGKDRHGKTIDTGLNYTRDDYLAMIKARVTLLAGNHDSGHNCDVDGICLLLDLPRYKGITVGHYPSITDEDKNAEIPTNISHKHTVGYQGNYGDTDHVHIHLCGHVHQSWLFAYDDENRVLNVNVGVDQWDYKPVSENDLAKLLDAITSHFVTKYSNKSFTMTRKMFEARCEEIQRRIVAERAKRKAEKMKKKGLTPEECERRKQEAMMKKKM